MTGAMEAAEFSAAMRDLAAAYNKTVNETVIASYWDGLNDMPVRQVCEGMRLAKRDAKFMPSVAVIRECVRLAVQSAPSLAVSRPQLDEGQVWCVQCDDTGFMYLRPNGVPSPTITEAVIERHRRVAFCPCRHENPMYRWKRSQERRTSAKPE